jgi:hypothetical protein
MGAVGKPAVAVAASGVSGKPHRHCRDPARALAQANRAVNPTLTLGLLGDGARGKWRLAL